MIAGLDSTHSCAAAGRKPLAESVCGETQAAIQSWLIDGNEAAAAWVVGRYRPYVCQIVEGWLPNWWMIDDVIQDTFAKAFQAMRRFDIRQSFKHWLAAIARNTCANAMRTHYRRNRVLVSGDEPAVEIESRSADTHPSALDAILARERRAGVRFLISQLDCRDREIMFLYHLKELPAEAVAERLDLTAGNVRIRSFRACQALRSQALAMIADGDL